LYVARPAPLANHNCGGAIDVTLASADGKALDMGTLHPSEEDNAEAIPKFPMFSKEITEAQVRNRALLRETMVAAGFVWYPGEWWHYCWGDRMWAVYTQQTECFYGPINEN
jgi:D-alanyl-D-alanine dipeptidase